LPDVTFIQPKRDGMTSRVVAPQTGPQQVVSQQVVDDRGPGFEGRAAKVQRLVSSALQEEPLANVGTGVGSKSSDGVDAHAATPPRASFKGDAPGANAELRRDDVTTPPPAQAWGDLGPVTILPGQGGPGAEGTPILEIIPDPPPGAQFFFATANTGIA